MATVRDLRCPIHLLPEGEALALVLARRQSRFQRKEATIESKARKIRVEKIQKKKTILKGLSKEDAKTLLDMLASKK